MSCLAVALVTSRPLFLAALTNLTSAILPVLFEYTLLLEPILATVLAYQFANQVYLMIDPLSKVSDVLFDDKEVTVRITIGVHGLVHVCRRLVYAIAAVMQSLAELRCLHS